MVTITGATTSAFQASGSTIKCMARAISYGQMAKNTSDSSMKTKERGKDALSGMMAENTMANGSKANSMGLAFIEMPRERREKENGSKGKEQDGLIDKDKAVHYSSFI